MRNTIIKKMVGCVAASLVLVVLAIGTVFAAGSGSDTSDNETEATVVQDTTKSVIFTWSGDYTKATATFINDNNEMEVVECDVLIDAESDQATYTAICNHETEDGIQTFKDVKVVSYAEILE